MLGFILFLGWMGTVQAHQMPRVLAGSSLVTSVASVDSFRMSGQLKSIRHQVARLELDLVRGNKISTKVQMMKMRKLFQLQLQEKKLGQKRIQELDAGLGRWMEQKSKWEAEKIRLQQAIRSSLHTLQQSELQMGDGSQDRMERPILKVLARLAHHSLGKMHELRHALNQEVFLEKVISQERQKLAFLSKCLQEQESILALTHQLQLDLLKKKQVGSIQHLESYQKLKTAEGLRNFFW